MTGISVKDRLFGKGRLPPGSMNKTEAAYAHFLEEEKRAGRVSGFWFESVKLKVAEGTCWYTPDFLIMRPDGALELHEVKGSPRIFMDDAKVKCKVTATKYPFPLFLVVPDKKSKTGWKVTAF